MAEGEGFEPPPVSQNTEVTENYRRSKRSKRSKRGSQVRIEYARFPTLERYILFSTSCLF
jgi:hypothetical protein